MNKTKSGLLIKMAGFLLFMAAFYPWEIQNECGSFSHLAFYADDSAMLFRQPSDDGKAYPIALLFLLCCKEWLKDSLLDLFRYSSSIVFYHKPDHALILRAQSELYLYLSTFLPNRVHSIGYQIQYNLVEGSYLSLDIVFGPAYRCLKLYISGNQALYHSYAAFDCESCIIDCHYLLCPPLPAIFQKLARKHLAAASSRISLAALLTMKYC